MKQLLTLLILAFSLSVSAQKKPVIMPVKDTSKYDATVSDSTGMVAYVKKDSTKLTILDATRTANALFIEYNKSAQMQNVLAYEVSVLRAIVKNITVTGEISNPKAYAEAVKAYIDYQTRNVNK